MQPSAHAVPRPPATQWIAFSGLAVMAAVFVATWLTPGSQGPAPFGIRGEFFLFAITLIGVALLHHDTLKVAVTGLGAILLFKFAFTDFHLLNHLRHEWRIL